MPTTKKPKDFDKYDTADSAASQLEKLAKELRQNGGWIKYQIQLSFYSEPEA
jgi:hypothetical protein